MKIILCDLLPMDIWKLLLGYHWKYDAEGQCNGKKNSFFMTMNDKFFKTYQLLKEREEKQVESSFMLVNGKDFIHIIKEKDN